MNIPCDKNEIISSMSGDIREIKGDVKTMLAYHHQTIGERRIRNKITKLTTALLTVVATVAGYIKFK